jgi:ABC-type arginine transport system ATPase subunit
LAEGEEALVSGEGDLVVAVQAAAVVDPAVGAFDHPAAWLDDEAVAGFGAGQVGVISSPPRWV